MKESREVSARLKRVRDDTMQVVAKSFSAKLPEYLRKRRKEFEECLAGLDLKNDIRIEDRKGKVYYYKLSRTLSKPLCGVDGVVPSKITAYDIAAMSRCYWDCVEEASEHFIYVPTIYQFTEMIGISTQTFVNYKRHQDASIREAVLMVYDKFVDYYTVRGLLNELNTIMAIFAMKAQYGLRDNEPAQVTVNASMQIAPKDYLEELEKKYDIDDGSIVDMEV